jgi:hypothetical protein
VSGQSVRRVAETSTALGGAATFNSPALDVDSVAGSYSKFRSMAFSDVAGTLNIQQARDNGSGAPNAATWRTTKTAAIPAGGTGVIIESLITRRWVRSQVVNGAGAEATLELDDALVAE